MKNRMRTIMLLLLTMLLLCPIQVLAAGGENAVKTDLEDGEYSIQGIFSVLQICLHCVLSTCSQNLYRA